MVPPGLQEFTKQNEVQLLTHSDPCREYIHVICSTVQTFTDNTSLEFWILEILPKDALSDVFGSDVNLHWVTRYQVHVKCRGVLSSKGYLVYINKPTTRTNWHNSQITHEREKEHNSITNKYILLFSICTYLCVKYIYRISLLKLPAH